MSNAAAQNDTQAALAEAVKSNALPSDVMPAAQKLLERLNTAVRIGLFGLPGSGKSTLLNLLVGYDLIPQGAKLPTTQVIAGDEAKAVLTLSDGSVSERDGTDIAAIARLSPMFVQLELTLPALSKISVLELVTTEDRVEQTRALKWASKRVDIALWCTDTYTSAEQVMWQSMPDNLKDHAFLLMTHADKHGGAHERDAAVAQIKRIAADQFAQILPISGKDAVMARGADGKVDKDRLRASGGIALISSILRQVELGRQYSVDQADILLRKNADHVAVPVEAPVAEPEKPKATRPVTKPRRPSELRAIERKPRPRSVPLQQVIKPPKIDAKPEQKGLNEEVRTAFEQAIDHLVNQGKSLAANDNISPKDVMSASVETVQWLSDHLSDNGPQKDETLARARDIAIDASDLVQLMQMEDRDSAADEALSLMIQLKRNLQADLAA